LAALAVLAPARLQLAPFLRLIAIERGAGRFELSSSKMAFEP